MKAAAVIYLLLAGAQNSAADDAAGRDYLGTAVDESAGCRTAAHIADYAAAAGADSLLAAVHRIYTAHAGTGDLLLAVVHGVDRARTAARDDLTAAAHSSYRAHAGTGDLLLAAVHADYRAVAAGADSLKAAAVMLLTRPLPPLEICCWPPLMVLALPTPPSKIV